MGDQLERKWRDKTPRKPAPDVTVAAASTDMVLETADLRHVDMLDLIRAAQSIRVEVDGYLILSPDPEGTTSVFTLLSQAQNLIIALAAECQSHRARR